MLSTNTNTKTRKYKLKIQPKKRNPLVEQVMKKGVKRHKNKLRDERMQGNKLLDC